MVSAKRFHPVTFSEREVMNRQNVLTITTRVCFYIQLTLFFRDFLREKAGTGTLL